MKVKHIIYFFAFLQWQFGISQYIAVDNTYTAENLVKQVLFNNSCGNVTNVSVSGGNWGNGQQSWGRFDANGSSFSFQDGIILSTGKIDSAVGPNTYIVSDDAPGWGGDSDLNQALGISNTFNATVLEFDFTPVTNNVSFDFILSSEQYLSNPTQNQCNYTDGFAFLIKPISSTNYQNIALVPNTNIPIKINTVRGPGTICPPANEQYFDAFNGVNHPTNFNGQTKSITAKANVVAGDLYHIKLVIADQGNEKYDSAIFLKGGSFSFDIDLGNDRTFANGNPVCFDESLTLDGTSFSATTYQWYFNNNIIPGETNSTLTLNPPYNSLSNGLYSVIVNAGDPCERRGDINLDFSDDLQAIDDTFVKCDEDQTQDGITQITATEIASIINDLFPTLPSNYNVALFANPTDSTPIPIPYTNSTAFTEILYAKITNFNCYANDAFPVNVSVQTFGEVINDETIGLCTGNTAVLQANLGYTYLWNTGETTSSISVTSAGTYSVILTNANSCTQTKTFTVIGSQIATLIDIVTTDFEDNNTAEIVVSAGGDYEFSLNGIDYQDSSIFYNLGEGEYTVYVNDKNGCGQITATFYILNYPKFFSPNYDGYNDEWTIKNLDKKGLLASKIYIFDRFGKLIHQIIPGEKGWNGTYNGKKIPADDYWFILELANGKTIKGHFALLR
ncbi:MAG: T9SS type B sorting domain-containing protein [Flavobacteriaceae bacterium]|nr:T9SS type B sorting domain-containing protein [Flavobacteriaceae bacterium]